MMPFENKETKIGKVVFYALDGTEYTEVAWQNDMPMWTCQTVLPNIKKVIFNYPATIVLWGDGTKTVVKCNEVHPLVAIFKAVQGKPYDPYDPEKGLAMAISKKALGNKGNYYNVFKKWLENEE